MELHCVSKTTLMFHTITSTHVNRFLVIYGRYVTERVCYQRKNGQISGKGQIDLRFCRVSKSPDCLHYNARRGYGQIHRIHQNMPFQARNSIFFLGRGLDPPHTLPPVGGVPRPHTQPSPQPTLLDPPPLRPPEFP